MIQKLIIWMRRSMYGLELPNQFEQNGKLKIQIQEQTSKTKLKRKGQRRTKLCQTTKMPSKCKINMFIAKGQNANQDMPIVQKMLETLKTNEN